MKPSEVVTERLPKVIETLADAMFRFADQHAGYASTPEDRAEFMASEQGQKLAGEARMATLFLYLDEEHERRQKWETSVDERLAKLEGKVTP